MRFLFVDRILEIEKGKFAKGIKNVSYSDEYLVNIVPNFPLMPRSLSVEAIAQLISWLVIYTKDFSAKPIAVMIDKTKFHDVIRPGDQLFIRAEINSMHKDEALCSGTAEVNGKIVTELHNGICAFIPIEELEDTLTVKRKFLSLFGRKNLHEFLKDADLKSRDNSYLNSDNNFNLNLMDKVVEIEIGKRVRGIKNITMTEDFIVDHFPKKHVMPGTMIVESFIQLSEKLLSDTIKAQRGSTVKILFDESRKLKFRQYVKPGDKMVVDINLIDLQNDTALVKAKATVDNKLVTAGELKFEIIDLSKYIS